MRIHVYSVSVTASIERVCVLFEIKISFYLRFSHTLLTCHVIYQLQSNFTLPMDESEMHTCGTELDMLLIKVKENMNEQRDSKSYIHQHKMIEAFMIEKFRIQYLMHMLQFSFFIFHLFGVNRRKVFDSMNFYS